MNVRVTGEQPDSYDVDLEMDDGSVRQVRIPRGWVEDSRGNFYANLDEDENDLSEQPTMIHGDFDDSFQAESPTVIDPARGRRREALVAMVLAMSRRR